MPGGKMPKLFEWDDSYRVDVGEMDGQHRMLIGYVNDLYEAMRRGDDREMMDSLLVRLLEYTIEHFGAEEEVMARAGYPGLDSHRKEHVAFRGKVEDFYTGYREEGRAITLDVMIFLKDWVSEHILSRDKDYSAFINGAPA